MRTPYHLTLESRVSNGADNYHFQTADGVCSKQSFRTAELQLLESLWNTDLGDLLCPEANYGVVGTVLSDIANSVHMTEASARAVQLCEANIRENNADATVSLLADLTRLERRFDTVAYAPKPYTALPMGQQRITDALSILRPGGSLYLIAAKHTGLSRYESCLRNLSADVEHVVTVDEYRLLKAQCPQTVDPSTDISRRRIHATVNGYDLSLVTLPGMFSASGLDTGTRLLMNSTTVKDGERVLDLCCGYGALGVYAAQFADCEVWLSDDNKVATNCAEDSLRASGLNGTVVTANCVDGVAGWTFDRILCNPPTHAGEGVLDELFSGAHSVLASDGTLSIVHHRSLDLHTNLTHYNSVERHCIGEEHVVLDVKP
ncbi:methyltransferase [Haladaptatus caseinilyticus]|uniref:methyltransferase n=1 Tax=Haladaptatus caseinilyticus TaxID=2993314 RepID=UPI00224A6FD9|nr:methyltransferase [Haladaptatus caseinilyticus]